MYFIGPNALFTFFCFIYFLKKHDGKRQQKLVLPKKAKNNVLGTPKWTQNGEEIVDNMQKITKMILKDDVLRGRFFDDFLDGPKIGKN